MMHTLYLPCIVTGFASQLAGRIGKSKKNYVSFMPKVVISEGTKQLFAKFNFNKTFILLSQKCSILRVRGNFL